MIWLVLLSLLIWIGLIFAHGRFWQSGPELSAAGPLTDAPAVAVVVPARDEAATIGAVLSSLLAQDYAGKLRIVLVDDASTDSTGAIARALADPRLAVIAGSERPAGWSGKLWAVAQGIDAARDIGPAPEFLLLCDADIVHKPGHLSTLVAAAQECGLDLVSEMVALNCQSLAEHALVPAFVYFFQLLYPFARVNDPLSKTAAAAGGTMLLRVRALDRIGGIATVRGALIDDVALAGAVKRGGRIWLGHTHRAHSLRAYQHADDIWRMIARTAYVQLRFSPLWLAGTILGMALVWLVPPLAALFGHGPIATAGWLAWALAAGSFLPTLGRFRVSPFWAPVLPAVAAFYMAATIGAAVDYHRGRGVSWKGRSYPGQGA